MGDVMMQQSTFVALNLQQQFADPLHLRPAAPAAPAGTMPPQHAKLPCPGCLKFTLI